MRKRFILIYSDLINLNFQFLKKPKKRKKLKTIKNSQKNINKKRKKKNEIITSRLIFSKSSSLTAITPTTYRIEQKANEKVMWCESELKAEQKATHLRDPMHEHAFNATLERDSRRRTAAARALQL